MKNQSKIPMSKLVASAIPAKDVFDNAVKIKASSIMVPTWPAPYNVDLSKATKGDQVLLADLSHGFISKIKPMHDNLYSVRMVNVSRDMKRNSISGLYYRNGDISTTKVDRHKFSIISVKKAKVEMHDTSITIDDDSFIDDDEVPVSAAIKRALDRYNEEVSEANRMTSAEVAQSDVAIRYSSGKPRYDLIPPEALEGAAAVLAIGAKKYAARNWEKGMDWSEHVIRPLMSHLTAFMKGENIDGEGMTAEAMQKEGKTGQPHTAHILVNAMFLHTYFMRQVGKDDRAKIIKKPID